MGAAVSTRSSFKEHEAYEAWTLEAIKNVLNEKLAGKLIVSTRADRKDFFGMFNSFDFVLPSGGFATLPVNEFNRFLDAEEKADSSKTIAIRRPLMLLIVLCEPGNSRQDQRLQLLAQCACRKFDAQRARRVPGFSFGSERKKKKARPSVVGTSRC